MKKFGKQAKNRLADYCGIGGFFIADFLKFSWT